MSSTTPPQPDGPGPKRPHSWLWSALASLDGLAARVPAEPPSEITEAWSHAEQIVGPRLPELLEAAAHHLGVPVADVAGATSTAIKLIPERVARRFLALPISADARTIFVASADPQNLEVERDLEFASGRRVEFLLAPAGQILERLEAEYAPDKAAEELVSGFALNGKAVVLEREIDPDESQPFTEEHTLAVRRLAATLLRDAYTQGASDIHLSPQGGVGVVRYRVDGIMQQVLTMPDSVYARVVSRLKVIGLLDISDSRRPQDGRGRIVVDGKEIDLRISSLPLEGGRERLVIRLLTHDAIESLDKLDLVEPERQQLLTLLRHADGMVLMTGPTGSGKTTTLHAALRWRMSPDVTIMTVENPVEYRIEGVSQVQVEPKAGVTFASALRAMLRQDPDIVLVGEIRDEETAQVAAQAAMTGHFVLSTVHVDDAPGALLRLRDLGLEIDTLTETFRGAAAQRLLRKVCKACAAAPTETDASPDERTFREITGAFPPVHAVGCEQCGFTGYRSRLPIHQVFSVTDEIKRLVLKGAPSSEVRAAARAAGMRSLGESALTRIQLGQTTVEEAVRMLGSRFWDDIRGDAGSAAVEPPEATDFRLQDLLLSSALEVAKSEVPSVLVYSADAATRRTLVSGVSAAGIAALEAASLADVGRLAKGSGAVRLLLLDIGPDAPAEETSALGLLVELRRLLRELSLPVVLVATAEHSALPFMTRAAGVNDFIPQPVTSDAVAERVRAALRRADESDAPTAALSALR